MDGPAQEFDTRFADNPFHVLGLRPGCTRTELEREAQKWLGMLELDLAAAASYATPLGPRARTPEKVRWAAAELRDPKRRAVHELWAELEPGSGVAPEQPADKGNGIAGWPEALRAFGWRDA